MKNRNWKLRVALPSAFLAMILLLAAEFAQAQNRITEGTVVYEISYENTEIPESHAAMMPSRMTTWFKKNKSRMEMKSGMGSTVYLYNHKAREMVMLMDMMGRKFKVSYDEAQVGKMRGKDEGDYQVEKTGKTMEIAGYPCKHAIVKSKEGSFDLYYTPDVYVEGSEWVSEFGEIDGLPLQYTMEEGGMSMVLKASSVSTDAVDEKLFVIPEGYQEMTAEEMMKQYGGK